MASFERVKFLLWLLCVCSSLAGVQFVYSIQFAVGTPLFVDQLKMSSSIAAIILATAGPISGFIVQPIVGILSDSSESRFGRRRPFIIAGTIVCAVGMAIIANSSLLGNMMGDDENGNSASDHTRAIVLAIVGLWIMNLCVNIIQGPARAIIADIVSEEEQQTGNSMVAGVMGISAVIANLVGAQFFGRPEPYRWLFLIGVIFVLFSMIPTLIAAKEKQFFRGEGVKKPSITGVFVKIFIGFKTMPGPLARIAFLYFLAWCAFSPFMIFISTYFGVNVNGGSSDSNADISLQNKYHDGIKIAMYALAGMSAFQWLYSTMLPSIIKVAGIKVSYIIAQVIATVCYLLLPFYPHPLIAPIILMCAIAPNFVTFNAVPFALIGGTSKGDAGLYMGVLNSAGVVAQTVTNSACSGILSYKQQDVSWAIGFGGILSVLACIWALFIQTPDSATVVKEETPLLKNSNQSGVINSEALGNPVSF